MSTVPHEAECLLTLPHPLGRFRSLYGALDSEVAQWSPGRWLRFAAQAVLMNPQDPAPLARRIHLAANRLKAHAGWFDGLRGEGRFFIASMLVQSREEVTPFLGLLDRTREHFADVGLPHGGLHDALAILILHLLGRSRGIPLTQIERLTAIHAGLQRHDWWHTGAKALPVCALLTAVPGPSEAVTALVVDIRQRLAAEELVDGGHLLGAAALLPLSQMPPLVVVRRYLDLVREARLHLPLHFFSDEYDALALLALLDQPPIAVVERLTAIHGELELADPAAAPTWTFALAADLTFLDLIRWDGEGRPQTEIHAIERMMDRIHLHRALLAVLAEVTEDALWPVAMPVVA